MIDTEIKFPIFTTDLKNKGSQLQLYFETRTKDVHKNVSQGCHKTSESKKTTPPLHSIKVVLGELN